MTADELCAYAKENNITLPNDKGANTNWNDEVLRTAISHNHNVLSMEVQKKLNTVPA